MKDKKTKLEIIKLITGEFVKPINECGTCGFYPKAWQIAPIRHFYFSNVRQSPIDAFLNCNKNWNINEVTI